MTARAVVVVAVLADAMPCGHAKNPEYDTARPARVVDTMIDAARTGNDAQLAGLCEHAQVALSAWAHSICGLHKGDAGWKAFYETFKDATIGPIVLDHTREMTTATVPLGDKHAVHLVFDRYDWYPDSIE